MGDIDHYDLSNTLSEAKSHTDDKARDLEYYVDDKVNDLKAEDRHMARTIEGLKDRVSQLEEKLEQLNNFTQSKFLGEED